MSERFEVQGRRRQPSKYGPAREEVRLTYAETLNDALATAKLWAGEGLTVWVYRVERGNGVCPVYHSVRKFEPQSSTSSTTDSQPKNHNSQARVRVA